MISKVEFSFELFSLISFLLLSLLLSYAFGIIVFDLMDVNVLQTDGGVLVQSSNYFWRGDTTCHYFLPVLPEFIVDV